MRNAIIIEDDIVFGAMLKKWFVKNGFNVILCNNLAKAKESFINNSLDLAICDLRLPDGEGTSLLKWVRDSKISTPFIMMTSYAQIQSAVEAMKLGAEDYLEKPIDPLLLKNKIDKIFNITPSAPLNLKDASNNKDVIIGDSPSAKVMYDYILKVAPTKLSVLILGESGTGKEYAASLIHNNSNRKDKPFLAVDCGSLSKELAASELFGHKKGSFTTALSDKVGVFEQANGGTIFLDEVGNLSYDVQVQLLRALQEQKIRPVGSAIDKTVDIRIIAATNENLEQAMQQGKFREDLFHRLNEFSFIVPPLRERRQDIELFAKLFLKQANIELNKDIKKISQKALSVLESQYWSGNLRELRNVIRRASLFANKEEILESDLPPMAELPIHCNDEYERIKEALRVTKGNKSKAAELLQIDRKTLYNKLAKYGL